MKDKIEIYLRNMKPLDSVGKWVLATEVFGSIDNWGHHDYDEFEKAIRSVVRKLRKANIPIREFSDWIHR